MKFKFNTILGGAALSAALMIGCAASSEYNQGSAADTESGSSTATTVPAEDPGVASESGNTEPAANKSPESQFNTLGSASAPSATVPANVATNGTDAGPNSEPSTSPAANEQGNQANPEPNTGDDVNPDQVKPQ